MKAALQLALDALKSLLPFTDYIQDEGPSGEGWKSDELKKAISDSEQAIAAAKQALAQPVQRPWADITDMEIITVLRDHAKRWGPNGPYSNQVVDLVRAIEAKLKERNT